MHRAARRRWVARSVVVALALVAALVAAYQLARSRCWQPFAPIVCRVDGTQHLVAISFDDGPTPDGVAAILPELDKRGVKATFFLIGRQVRGYPGLARQISASGHEIGNHSMRHKHMAGLTPGAYVDELTATDALLRADGVQPVRYFRPPYGVKTIGLPLAVRRTGHVTVMWDVEEHGDAPDPRAYADHILRQVRPGSIILIHAMYRHRHIARAALPMILDGLAERGLTPTTVGALIASAQKEN